MSGILPRYHFVTTLRTRQNGRHFSDDSLKLIFWYFVWKLFYFDWYFTKKFSSNPDQHHASIGSDNGLEPNRLRSRPRWFKGHASHKIISDDITYDLFRVGFNKQIRKCRLQNGRSMASCKTAVPPLRTHWRYQTGYCSLALSHRCILLRRQSVNKMKTTSAAHVSIVAGDVTLNFDIYTFPSWTGGGGCISCGQHVTWYNSVSLHGHCPLTHLPQVPHICVSKLSHHWFR